jgi:hypothetical protein
MQMVHHGYERPGHGYIEGDCYGVGWAPFELSPDGTIAYVERALQPKLENHTNYLQRLQAGEITEVPVEVRLGFGKTGTKILTPADGYDFSREIRMRIINTENMVRWLTRDIRERTQKVAQWQEHPVRTEEEVEQVRARMTDQRRSAIEVARAVKQARREAFGAKQSAREQERLDLMNEYRAIFNELALDGSPEAIKEAKAQWIKMFKRKGKKGYLRFGEPELGIDEALLTLGLAAPNPNPHGMWQYRYSNEHGWEPR